jgi:protein phosphatase
MTTLSHACLSDAGRTHESNQDRWFADPAYGLFIIADGMAVEEPAQTVVDLLPDVVRRRLGEAPDLSAESSAEAIRAAIAEVSEKVHGAALEASSCVWVGLGATIVLALVRGTRALLAHLGDSRVYLMRDRQLELMTRDHSRVEEFVRLGKLTREQAAQLKGNGGPTRFAGMADEAVADTRLVELRPGDRLLLCSDGLTSMLDDPAIARILTAHPTPASACRALIDAANHAGGEDNITVLIADAN